MFVKQGCIIVLHVITSHKNANR